MSIKKNPKLVPWESHLDKKYGKKGTSTRIKYAQEFEIFLSKVIEEGMMSGVAHDFDPWKNLVELKSKRRQALDDSEGRL